MISAKIKINKPQSCVYCVQIEVYTRTASFEPTDAHLNWELFGEIFKNLSGDRATFSEHPVAKRSFSFMFSAHFRPNLWMLLNRTLDDVHLLNKSQ